MNMELFFGILSVALAMSALALRSKMAQDARRYQEHVADQVRQLETSIIAAWGSDVNVDVPESTDECGNIVAAHVEVQRQLINPEFVKQWESFKSNVNKN